MRNPEARIMIAALHGASGKTVITLGILRALTQRGRVVVPYKKGPDFIDPGWHTAACGQVSRNLDSYFMTPECICGLIRQRARPNHLSIIEGAMGLFDGLDVEGSSSSAHIAKISATPVLLVVDATRMTRTAAALVLGCQQFDPDLVIAGVILNKVRGLRQKELMTTAIEQTCGIPVVGAVLLDERLSMASRHLGLVSSTEAPLREEALDNIANAVSRYVDLAAIERLAAKAPPLPRGVTTQESPSFLQQRTRMGVIRDDAFCFYYEENLEALARQNVELVFIDSLKDKELPQSIHMLYIGGGFPEVFAAQLQNNQALRASIYAAVKRGLPVYAEGGGLMYLGKTLEFEGVRYNMVGALDLNTRMRQERLAHGYTELQATASSSWFEGGTLLKGHEFRHAEVEGFGPQAMLMFNTVRGTGIVSGREGFYQHNTLALTTHVNAYASPAWAPALAAQARAYKARTLSL